MARGRLFLHRIADDFDPQRDVAAGPWCFIGKEDVWREWDEQPFFTPFVEARERAEQAQATRWLAHQVTHRLAAELNRRHGLDRPVEFWHRVLIVWAVHLVQGAWRLYATAEHLARIHTDVALDVQAVDAAGLPAIEHTAQFIDEIYASGPLPWGLLSRAVRELAPGAWTINDVACPPYQAAKALQAKPRATVHHIPGVRRRRDIAFTSVLRGLLKIAPARRSEYFVQPVEEPAQALPEAFVRIVDWAVAQTLPKVFTEGFAAVDAEISGRGRKPGKTRVGFINYFDDTESIETAHALMAGERVVSVQHGGGYAWAAAFDTMAEAEYGLSNFVTWGWDKHANYRGNFTPLPAPMLSRHKHRGDGDEMLMVGGVMYGFTPRLDQHPPFVEYRREKGRFIGALDDGVMKRARYRPFYLVSDFRDGDYVKERFPDMALHTGDFHESMLGCKLLVLDHPSTPLSQALAWNVPTVAFWDQRGWAFDAAVEPLFNRLREVGILFDNPADAARQVNRVWDDVDAWWSDPALQEARGAWCEQYARNSRTWWLTWWRKAFTL